MDAVTVTAAWQVGSAGEVAPKDLFLKSLARCDRTDEFVSRFYERFSKASLEVREKFQHTDFTRQRRMLHRSLELAAQATVGDPDGLRELTARAETHFHVSEPLYGLWLDAAVATAAECDPEWSADVEAAWRSIIGFVIGHMRRHR